MVVFCARPESTEFQVEAVVPLVVAEPVFCPRALVVPHWNHTVVLSPFGFTEPFIVPPLLLMLVVARVVTVGGTAQLDGAVALTVFDVTVLPVLRCATI